MKRTRLEHAQASTLMVWLFTIVARIIQYKDSIRLQRPSTCPVKDILVQVTESYTAYRRLKRFKAIFYQPNPDHAVGRMNYRLMIARPL